MKIDFCIKTKDIASQLVNEKTDFSLFIAEKFLNQIPAQLDVTDTIQHAEFEIASEGFLSFIINARDSLLQEINKKLNLGFSVENVKLKDILNKLNSEQGKKLPAWAIVYNLLDECIHEPEKVIDSSNIAFWDWDRTKSWMWELEELRNTISHRSIISRHIVISTEFSTSMTICTITKSPILRNNGNAIQVPIPNPKPEPIREKNPQMYFTNCYAKFIELRGEIRKQFPS